MGRHHDAWIQLLGTKMTMRCDVIMSHPIKHAHTKGVCGRTSFDSARVVFGWQRQTHQWSDEITKSYENVNEA